MVSEGGHTGRLSSVVSASGAAGKRVGRCPPALGPVRVSSA
ncbi:hypothetical protein SHJG_0501 [Streptomyces hygroscopicus subsp. jinggangensis 5008]|nr:hypothetical protein SHJG_0501 [Streptomyces hygroscopicus subsp. jinggangensis 5008]AGF60000.1 hypothetical protein SHJGH_0334 [Streptomyces hygroscopicus subsp. jinggangensis TL01]